MVEHCPLARRNQVRVRWFLNHSRAGGRRAVTWRATVENGNHRHARCENPADVAMHLGSLLPRLRGVSRPPLLSTAGFSDRAYLPGREVDDVVFVVTPRGWWMNP